MSSCQKHKTYIKECAACRKAKQDKERKLHNDKVLREVLNR